MNNPNFEDDYIPPIEYLGADKEQIKDPITPEHYHKNGFDVFKIMEVKFPRDQIIGFHRGNILKYIIRYQDKGGVEDLKKARRYLDKLIEVESCGSTDS